MPKFPESGLVKPGAARVRVPLALLGPAFVAAIAYVDPGNVAANLTAGARYGYLLLWVLIVANAIAVIVQYQSAKLGIVTGQSLPEILGSGSRPAPPGVLDPGRARRRGHRHRRSARRLSPSTCCSACRSLSEASSSGSPPWRYSLCNRGGQRTFEVIIVTLLAVIVVGFVTGLFFSGVDGGQALAGIVPRFEGTDSVLLATSMLGATVMPHVIYLHSALTRDRHGVTGDPVRIRHLLRATRWDVGGALFVAGAVNISMLLLAASALRGIEGTDTIDGAHAAVVATLGPAVGVIFAIGLLASGLASTSVGTYAGSAIMGGLLKVRVPLLLRRAITLVPALVILAIGFDPTRALVLSQVVLSFGIPFALIPLVWLASSRKEMGEFVNAPWLRVAGWAAAALITVLNVLLIVLVIAGG